MTVKVDVARTCPTLLSAWMLEYGVGYYVEPPTQENSLGGRTLAVYTLQAQLVAPGDPDSFTRFRPYLAHCFPVLSRFLRVFTAWPRRFQRAPSRNPGPRNSRLKVSRAIRNHCHHGGGASAALQKRCKDHIMQGNLNLFV